MDQDKWAILRPTSPICSLSPARRIQSRTVLAANVFPTCGRDAMFSNAINYSFVVRRANVAGLGDAAKFETAEQEIRFSCPFRQSQTAVQGPSPVQRGTCTLPDGQNLRHRRQ